MPDNDLAFLAYLMAVENDRPTNRLCIRNGASPQTVELMFGGGGLPVLNHESVLELPHIYDEIPERYHPHIQPRKGSRERYLETTLDGDRVIHIIYSIIVIKLFHGSVIHGVISWLENGEHAYARVPIGPAVSEFTAQVSCMIQASERRVGHE